METNFYVISAVENASHPLGVYVFGPYKTREQAEAESERVGGWEIVELPTADTEEAVGMVREMYQ